MAIQRWQESTPSIPGSAWDLVVLAIVPVVLVGVFSLPEATRRGLAFRYTDPSLLTAFTAHFVHMSLAHLLTNLLSYLLLATVGYLLAVRAELRQLFLTALVTFLFAFPFVISALNLAFPRNAVTFGFSAITMALVGLLPLLLTAYAAQHAAARLRLEQAPAFFFLPLAAVSILVIPSVFLTAGMVVVTVSAGYLSLLIGHSDAENRDGSLSALLAALGQNRTFLTGACLLLVYPVIGFQNPTSDGQVLNLYSHLLGYCLAFIVSYLACGLGVATEYRNRPVDFHRVLR